MGVAVLHPQDCLRKKPSYQTTISPPPNMKLPNPNPKPPRNTRTQPNRQKRVRNMTRPASTSGSNPQGTKLVIGQVKILKRGEQLTKTSPDPAHELPLTGGFYASPMFPLSPSPSSVPLPIFITKKIAAVSDATNVLRKVLQLDVS